MQEKVIIVLSTYNAQEYLAEQLESLFQQTYPNIEIVIRDDGSTDQTVAMVARYCEEHENLTFYQGENVGAAASFFDLMKNVRNREFAYCAFCDQDDVWLPDKVEVAVAAISSKSAELKNTASKSDKEEMKKSPILYCSRAQLVDASLQPIKEEIKKEIRPAFANALIENIVTGCTTVLNREMYEIAVEHIPNYCIMHDWWLYLLASSFGTVLYDKNSRILYRQHGNNAMGIDGSYKTELKNRIRKYGKRRNNLSKQAAEYVRLLEEKGEDKIKEYASYYNAACILAQYKENFAKRKKLVSGRIVYRQRKADDWIYRILFLLGIR